MSENKTTGPQSLAQLLGLPQNPSPEFKAWLRDKLERLLEAEQQPDPRGRVRQLPTIPASSPPLAGPSTSGLKPQRSSSASQAETPTPLTPVAATDFFRPGSDGSTTSASAATSGPILSLTPSQPTEPTDTAAAGGSGNVSRNHVCPSCDHEYPEGTAFGAVLGFVEAPSLKSARADCVCGHSFDDHGVILKSSLACKVFDDENSYYVDGCYAYEPAPAS